MKLATVCIFTKAYEKKRAAQLVTLRKWMPDWDHVDVICEEHAFPGVSTEIGIARLRPKVVLDLFGQGYEGVLFLGADVMFYSIPHDLYSVAAGRRIGLTPHTLELPPVDGHHPSPLDFMKAGRYNADFAFWPNTLEARYFLAWQEAVMQKHCGPETFFDQGWLGMIDPTEVIELPPRYNVAYYNLHERSVVKRNGKWTVNGHAPLVAYHFTGFVGPDSLSKHQDRLPMTDDLRQLYTEYAEAIK